MRFLTPLIAAALAFTGTAATARDRSPEAELAKALQGRIAGKPVKCLLLSDIRSTQVIDRVGFLYESRRGVVYLNRVAGARSLDWTDVPVVESYGGYLCEREVVRLADRNLGFQQTGFVNLGKFVPYTKPKTR